MLFAKTLAAFLWTSSLLCWSPSLAIGAYGDTTSYTTGGEATSVRRERNLDHWDSDTLAYYLDDYPGYDVAVLFYAQWDQNSHALAPYWDRIATLLDAGTSQSRLVMALFDCELNHAHAELCKVLSVTHYPTIMFVGSGPYHDTDPFTRTLFGSKAAGVMGPSPVPNTVKFQGNWQYYDSILDWIRTMQSLSNWHTWTTKGFGRRLRNLFLPHKTPNSALPIGVPRSFQKGLPAPPAHMTTASSATGAAESVRVQELERQISQLNNITGDYERFAMRTASMLDNILVPTSEQDMFAMLDQEQCWNKQPNTAKQEIMKSCVAEMSLDYCQKVSTKVATDLVSDLEASGKTVEEMVDMDDLEQQVLERIAKAEPYCAILDQCVITEFEDAACTPKTCPFQNEIACRYLSSCLEPMLQNEYAAALGLSLEEPATTATGAGAKSGWGI